MLSLIHISVNTGQRILHVVDFSQKNLHLHLLHLYSAFRIIVRFSNVALQFFIFLLRPLFHTVSFHFSWGGATPSQINSLGSIQVCHLMHGNISFSFGRSMQHSFTQSLMADRGMEVGHVHTCSFMCTSHIGMTAHTSAFTPVGEHSGNLLYAHMTLAIAEHSRCQSHLGSQQCVSDGYPSKY